MPLLTLGWIVCAAVGLEASEPFPSESPTVAPRQHHSSPSSRLLDDARDGRLEEFGLVEAALIAGGIDRPPRRQELGARFNEICARSLIHVKNTGGGTAAEQPTWQRVRSLFQFMHQEVLTGQYQVSASRLSRTLQRGSYNCVTATVLFNSLCEAHGLSASAVVVRGHVFSRVHAAEAIDIQTTCPRWFDSAEARRRPATLPNSLREISPREITAVQLIGKIYYNRAVSELHRERFAEAVDLLALSLMLDPADSSAQENLLAALNNWSLHACQDGHFAHAAGLVRRGLAINPDYAPLLVNDVHIHERWAVSLCDEDRHEAALSLLERGYARRPEVALFDDGRAAICDLWAERLFQQGHTDSARRVLVDARRRFRPTP